MKPILVIVLVAMACGLGGYQIGRNTAPGSWPDEREELRNARWSKANLIRLYREELKDKKKRRSGPLMMPMTSRPMGRPRPKTKARPAPATRPASTR